VPQIYWTTEWNVHGRHLHNVYNSALMATPSFLLTLILLTWRIWRAPNNASKWQMRFNSAFKGLIPSKRIVFFKQKSNIKNW